MAEWHKVAVVADVPLGTGKEIAVSGRLIALFNVDGEFRAIDGICAHQGGPLGKGKLTGGSV